MALGVARGMQALEKAQPPILHRDLKPSNVFIDAGASLIHNPNALLKAVCDLQANSDAVPAV